jgi:hypothetical protein
LHSAATRYGAFPSLPFAPRTVLPPAAITSRPPAAAALLHSHAPENRVEYVSADLGERASAGRLVGRAAARPASTSGPPSAAHWSIAANDLAGSCFRRARFYRARFY